MKNIAGKLIIESAEKILSKYIQHRKPGKEVFDKEIIEMGKLRTEGIQVSAELILSKQIEPIATGRQEVPREHVAFAKFDFPQNSFKEDQCQVKIDPENYKLAITGDETYEKLWGEFLIGDISSMVLNDDPTGGKYKNKRWIRINGRKIRKDRKSVV